MIFRRDAFAALGVRIKEGRRPRIYEGRSELGFVLDRESSLGGERPDEQIPACSMRFKPS